MTEFNANNAKATLPLGNIDVKASLNVAIPKQGNPHGSYNHDRLIMVPINQIDRYEDNPRRRRKKDAWLEFKESIRAVGVKQPIKITQKPGTNRYQIIEGGNSRHSALEELYAETGDEKFSVIPALFQEWDEETFKPVNILLAHITENEMRSEVIYWDKAQGYYKAIFLLGITNESARNISSSLKQTGNIVSYELITQFLFANSKLKSLNQLCYDLSGIKVVMLRKTYHDLKKLLGAKVQEFDTFWESALSSYAEANSTDSDDEPTLKINKVIKFINENFIEQFPEAALALLQQKNRVPSIEDKDQSTLFGASEVSVVTSEATNSELTTDDSLNAEMNNHPETTLDATNEIAHGSTEGFNHSEHINHNHSMTTVGIGAVHEFANSLLDNQVSDDDKSLHDCILELMNYCGIGHLFRDIPSFPFQFFIELPYFSSDEGFDGRLYPFDSVSPYARDVWWLLANISNQLDSTNDVFMSIPNDSFFMQTFIDSAIWQGYIKNQLGESTPFAMENWLMYCPDETFVSLLTAMLRQVRQINCEIFKDGEMQ